MGIRVLLVDDEEGFTQTLAKRLKVRRFEIDTACSGEAALERVATDPVDVVVVDVRMPGMNGIEVTRALKNRFPLVEVILLSGHANLEASAEGLELGAFDYLLKPVSIDELVYKIEDAHRKKALQEEKILRLRRTSAEMADDGS
jgi:DNA-binding response OmpR family regulator